MEEKEINFEQAFGRLEEILQKMNTSELALDKSLAYYEEADRLIQKCQSHLKNAEKKVETLVKNRNQELQLNQDGSPSLQPFKSQYQRAEPTV